MGKPQTPAEPGEVVIKTPDQREAELRRRSEEALVKVEAAVAAAAEAVREARAAIRSA